ncbi:hypothetical protein M9458_050401 [Cirrhinus mrigala]|uniref:Uncharacterized protein n=1 Tax=Cirrhinus mrigala TaxID=683832 RepID=A0ABD0MYF0_CIRMR
MTFITFTLVHHIHSHSSHSLMFITFMTFITFTHIRHIHSRSSYSLVHHIHDLHHVHSRSSHSFTLITFTHVHHIHDLHHIHSRSSYSLVHHIHALHHVHSRSSHSLTLITFTDVHHIHDLHHVHSRSSPSLTLITFMIFITFTHICHIHSRSLYSLVHHIHALHHVHSRSSHSLVHHIHDLHHVHSHSSHSLTLITITHTYCIHLHSFTFITFTYIRHIHSHSSYSLIHHIHDLYHVHSHSDYEENGEKKTETTYTYSECRAAISRLLVFLADTEWKSEVISSRHFDQEVGHTNPSAAAPRVSDLCVSFLSAMAVESVTVVAQDVWVTHALAALSHAAAGVLMVKHVFPGLVDQITDFHTLSLQGLPVPFTNTFLTVYDDYFYHTANPRRPEVGDVRIRFSYAGLSGDGVYPGPAHKVSVVAMRQGDQLKPFKTRSGDVLEILYMGDLSAEEVFAKEHQLNDMKTWALRLGGWVLMFLGVSLSTRIIYTLGNSHTRTRALRADGGLGSCAEGAGVGGAEDLRALRLVFAVAAHHRRRMDLLPPSAGRGDRAARVPAVTRRTRKSAGKEKPMTSLTSSSSELLCSRED